MNKHLNWDLKHYYTSIDDPQITKDINKYISEADKIYNKWFDNTEYTTNPIVLKKLISDLNNFYENYDFGGKSGYYIYLSHYLDIQNTKILAKINQLEKASIDVSNKLHTFIVKLSKIDKETQNKFLKSKELKEYSKFLYDIFKFQKHTLALNEESILSKLTDLSSTSWSRLLNGLLSSEETILKDSKGKSSKYNFQELISSLNSEDKVLRDNAADAFNIILQKYDKVSEAELNAILGFKSKYDEIKKYTHPEDSRLLSDDIDKEVVNSLRAAISIKYSISKDFYKLKAKILKVNKLHYHERGLEYTKGKRSYSLNYSIDNISNVFLKIDKEFYDIFQDFIRNNKIDSKPFKGKESGAFCFHTTKTLPTQILLNYHSKLEDLLTLAHEVGHGINNEMIRNNQIALYFNTPASTAEVASTFFEDYVAKEILKESKSKDERIAILLKKLDMDISTVFRQIAFYNFEIDLHREFREKHYLSFKEIGVIFQKHMKDYMGDYVIQDKGSQNWWVYVPHFRYYFYVYSYSFGILTSKIMQRKLRRNPEYLKSIKVFLSSGYSLTVKDLFKKIDIDITDPKIWLEGIKEIEQDLKTLSMLIN